MICITCGEEAGPLSPEMAKAKARMGMPLDPPKRCPACVWSSLKKFAETPDDVELETPFTRVAPGDASKERP